MLNPELQLQLKTLPNQPGVYQYYDKEGNILYIGKAKNLKELALISLKITIMGKLRF